MFYDTGRLCLLDERCVVVAPANGTISSSGHVPGPFMAWPPAWRTSVRSRYEQTTCRLAKASGAPGNPRIEKVGWFDLVRLPDLFAPAPFEPEPGGRHFAAEHMLAQDQW